jgi:hypothetical protein
MVQNSERAAATIINIHVNKTVLYAKQYFFMHLTHILFHTSKMLKQKGMFALCSNTQIASFK